MIVDATGAPSKIRYPQDVSLLNEARESAEKLLDVLHDPADGKKPRTYRQRARKDYLKYVRCRKHTAKMTRKAIGKPVSYTHLDVGGDLSALTQRGRDQLLGRSGRRGFPRAGVDVHVHGKQRFVAAADLSLIHI